MVHEKTCVWCGRGSREVKRLIPGPLIYICNYCAEALASGEEQAPSAKVREEVERAVSESFQRIVKQLNLGPLQEKYVRLMHVKFKEEPGSPSFEEVFREFKKGVEAEVPRDDYQTRYDLAIAYHEMELREDAFREMLESLRGALSHKDFNKAAEVMSALIHFHDDAARVIDGLRRVLNETAES